MGRTVWISGVCFFLATLQGCSGQSTSDPEVSHPVGKPGPIVAKKGLISYNGQDTFNRLKISSLHEKGYFGKGIIAAVMDDGIDFRAANLQGKFALGGGWRFHPTLQYVQGKKNSSYLMDHRGKVIPGMDLISYIHSGGHGQSMAEIFVGAANSGGAVGVAPYTKLMPFSPRLDTFMLNQFEMAHKAGARIVTFSFNGLDLRQLMEDGNNENDKSGDAVKDVAFVIIAGNYKHEPTPMESGHKAPFDTRHHNLIVTVAVDPSNHLTSNTAKCGNTQRFCIAVPSAINTSETAPVVGGTLALLMEAFPNLQASDYVQALLKTATPLGNPDETGVGLLDAEAAFQSLARNHQPQPPVPGAPDFSIHTQSDTQPALNKVVQSVAVGHDAVCAVVDGVVKCWGSNRRGCLASTQLYESAVPYRIEGLPGRAHGLSTLGQCAIMDDGTAYCWGPGHAGILGDGKTESSWVPLKIQGLPAPVLQIADGDTHRCFLTVNGEVYCVGNNMSGELGVAGKAGSFHLEHAFLPGHATEISAARENTCALLKNGAVYCFGSNSKGQLGPHPVAQSAKPLEVTGIHGAIHIATTLKRSCAILKDGTVWCWGSNEQGGLGSGLGHAPGVPVKVDGLGSPLTENVVDFAGVYADSTCVKTQQNRIFCWGVDENQDEYLATENPPFANLEFPLIRKSPYTTSCAVWPNGVLKCWGSGRGGTLGNGKLNDSPVPVEVQGLYR